MKTKKILAALAAAAMAVTATACASTGTSSSDNGSSAADGNSSAPVSTAEASGNSDANSESNSDAPAIDKEFNIGICQLLQHDALDAATKGFKDVLTEKLGDKVKFDEQNANNEATNCTTICTGFVAANVDLILANATGSLQAASAATATIPILGTSVTDYATALSIDDWTGATGKNISGTSDLAPIEDQAKMMLELFPDAKTVGILYCSAEPNSVFQAEKFTAALSGSDITVKEYTAADSNEINAATTTAVAECDVIYIPTDNTMAAATETIKNIVVPAKKPVIAGEEGICKGCGVASLSISYYELGRATGEMAYEILVNGADITTMKVNSAGVTKKYNAEICKELGITPPEGYEAIAE